MFARFRDREWTLLDLALAVAVTALAAVILTLSYVLAHDGQWKPLGPFPTQAVDVSTTFEWQVADGGNVQTIPAVGLAGDGAVPVTGTKCYREAVTVNGVVGWTVLDPPGRVFETGRGTAIKKPGCVTSSFENQIPADLAAAVEAAGHPFVVAVTGCETPTDLDRGEGATLCWSTEPFALVP